MQKLNQIDKKILRILQYNPTISNSNLAAQVGLSAVSVWRRVEKLECDGVIKGRELLLDVKALGYEVEVSLRVTLDKTQSDVFDRFIEAAREVPEINEIQTFLGRVDVRLNIIARNMKHYQYIYRSKILSLPHISDIEALMLVSNIICKEGLPL